MLDSATSSMMTRSSERHCVTFPLNPPLNHLKVAFPPSRLGIAQASLTLLSAWRRLAKGDLVVVAGREICPLLLRGATNRARFLENAASIASMFLTTECVLAEKPAENPMPQMPAGGMGGMM